MSIGENLKRLRLEKGFDQQEFAKAIEVTPGMVCQIERGSRSISLPLAYKAAEVLECSLYDFIESKSA